MYSIEELVKTFQDHHKKSMKVNEKLLEQFIENNPGQPVPEWYTDEFSLPLALSSMCAEILKLK